MRRTDIDDDGAKILAGTSAPSSGPPLGPTVIPFPGSAARTSRDQEGAGVSSASASSFQMLGDLTHAVVLRLAGGYPKIRGPVRPGGQPHRPSAALEGEEDAG